MCPRNQKSPLQLQSQITLVTAMGQIMALPQSGSRRSYPDLRGDTSGKWISLLDFPSWLTHFLMHQFLSFIFLTWWRSVELWDSNYFIITRRLFSRYSPLHKSLHSKFISSHASYSTKLYTHRDLGCLVLVINIDWYSMIQLTRLIDWYSIFQFFISQICKIYSCLKSLFFFPFSTLKCSVFCQNFHDILSEFDALKFY